MRILPAAAAAMSERPRLAVDAHGRLQVAWYDSRSADWRWSIRTVRWQGGSWTRARRVTGGGNATWPALAGDDVVFTTDRDARIQKDPTERVHLLHLRP